MTSKTIVLIRHAPTLENDTHVMLGHTNPPLHARGQKCAQQIADALIGMDFDVVITSPLLRAKQTAQRIATAHKRAMLAVDNRLMEVHLGVVDGVSSFTAYRDYKTEFDIALDHNTPDFCFPNGERWSQAVTRIAATLDDAANSRANRLCMVTHGALLGLWKSMLEGQPLGHFRKNQPPHASLSVIQLTDEGWQILRWGDTTHLCE
ncbi:MULTISPECIES: histidine phosphatase family protein [Alicyclobacillus]|uniref:Histidine phosphatase family protein n=1 Tax=Alicyclobacillus acidoterrestris (strain ATCC 49025 / DSM 3922 / CIP 106132 / NCIMB 13137 / GD3B) TaxID=1356854 RepID=T0BR89_ALIAG|nr:MULTISPECIES: histidine phosphatase family protein [Alicyclobacillus]EPZ43299.1 hypothetical protein N007_13455 [Alicyclobacillus acidoterrestris ATCC 49025]UNO47716.1 histidine phosphatase family protein [Alicyclobacillus acidoterrestris]GEO27365.1 putative phosphatase PhoE [Alicyclobacillus acidoterrestris]